MDPSIKIIENKPQRYYYKDSKKDLADEIKIKLLYPVWTIPLRPLISIVD